MNRNGNRSKQAGVAAVEFAIALPMLLMLFLCVVELGRAFLQYNALTRAVRDSARLVANEALLGQAGTVNLDAGLITKAKNVVLYGSPTGSGSVLLPGLAPGNVTVQNLGGGNISVTVAYSYQPMIGTAIPDIIRGGSVDTTFTLTAQVIMRALS